mgnify:CR=1 FL=1
MLTAESLESLNAAKTLEYIRTKYWLGLHQRRMPIEIPNVTRDDFARLTFLLGFTKGVEVGVERGAYSEVLLRENPLLHLSCVDYWRPYVGYRDHVDGRKLAGFYAETAQRLKPFSARISLIRDLSIEAAKAFADGSFDFVYLDGNHAFEYLTADLAAWSPKVRAGGIIAGHDFAKYQWPNQIHVVQVIQGWTDAYEIAPWFVLGRKEKREGELRDEARSWFYVHDPKPAWRKGQKPIKQ